jgi:hypothetical protein
MHTTLQINIQLFSRFVQLFVSKLDSNDPIVTGMAESRSWYAHDHVFKTKDQLYFQIK